MLTGGPTRTGAPQSSPCLARVETQMLMSVFWSAALVGRRDAMKNDFPSREMNGHPSRNAPLNDGSSVSVPSTGCAALQSPYGPNAASAAEVTTDATANSTTTT